MERWFALLADIPRVLIIKRKHHYRWDYIERITVQREVLRLRGKNDRVVLDAIDTIMRGLGWEGPIEMHKPGDREGRTVPGYRRKAPKHG